MQNTTLQDSQKLTLGGHKLHKNTTINRTKTYINDGKEVTIEAKTNKTKRWKQHTETIATQQSSPPELIITNTTLQSTPGSSKKSTTMNYNTIQLFKIHSYCLRMKIF